MLKSLSIENYALIQGLEITPDSALNIITGETGAGKSIMLGAIGLLLGNRADTKALLDTSKKCIIEGYFDISSYKLAPLFEEYDLDFEEECIVRREISPSGKSRAFVNDGISNLEFLKKLGTRLMDVHSQHETLQLGSNTFQLEILDAYAGNQAALTSYQKDFSVYQEKRRIFDELSAESSAIKKEADYHSFLLEELDKAAFEDGEQESLEDELKKLENAEEIKTKLNQALQLTDQSEASINSQIYELRQALSQIASFSSTYNTLKNRVEEVLIELKDLTTEIESEEDAVAYDPQRTQETQERLDLLYRLQQKHQVASIAELLKIHEEIAEKVIKAENLDDVLLEAEKEQSKAFDQLLKSGKALSAKRTSCFEPFSNELKYLLAELGMPDAQIKIDHSEESPTASGIDKVSILFSANKGIAPQVLKQAASGGEFSRLMFAIKYILADKTALPTIVFDEIDTGVSGEIALQLAKMMQKMAQNHQVITITHLPQIAAKGEAHYFVYKDVASEVANSQIKRLTEEERLQEIAQMIGGKSPSSKTLESAQELLSQR